MPSFSRSAKTRRLLQFILIATLVFVERAPFLLHADRFFTSDEAVEGLMATHVLQGEHPAFLWGQSYKGVPEVYLAAMAFAVTGPNVMVLKGVTLVLFALFVCLQHALVERLFSRAIAWMTTGFLVVSPPSLVLWSLSANAEVVLTMLAGAVMLLGVDIWRRTGSRPALMTACAAAGFGLWVHQYIIYYWLALGLTILHSLPQRRKVLARFLVARELPAWLRLLTASIGAVAVIYIGLGIAAFLTGGFDLSLIGNPIGVHHPQKMWNIAAGLLIVVAMARMLALSAQLSGPASTLIYAAALAFAVGYSPALAAYATSGGSPPIARADLTGIFAAGSPFVREILPIVGGARSPSTAWLPTPQWLGLALVFAIAASFIAVRERAFPPVFHILLVVTPVVFLMSGAFVDAQSYRYLMPAYGAAAVVLALGVWRIFRWSRIAGTVSLAMLLSLFALEQRAWYRELTPDTQSVAIIDCLDRKGVRFALADYWLSYKLTFLSDERIIVAPLNGVDRYAPYTAQVRTQAEPFRIPSTMGLSCTDSSSLR